MNNITSTRREDWEQDDRLLDYIGLLAYEYPKKTVAKKMGISLSTLKAWAKESPLIARALNGGKEQLVKELEETLKHRAKGYEYEEVKTITLSDGGIRIEKNTRHQPPDTTAAVFLITNLAPDKWNNHRKIEGNITTDDTKKLDEILNEIKSPDSNNE